MKKHMLNSFWLQIALPPPQKIPILDRAENREEHGVEPPCNQKI